MRKEIVDVCKFRAVILNSDRWSPPGHRRGLKLSACIIVVLSGGESSRTVPASDFLWRHIMVKTAVRLPLIAVSLFVISISCQAQINPPPAPPKPPETDVPQDSVKTLIEEVRIPITAKDANGRFDPTVELSDLMVRE